jgi:hypothetical protein
MNEESLFAAALNKAAGPSGRHTIFSQHFKPLQALELRQGLE